MKKVLVTGGAGYVGCVLVPRLLAAGYAVKVYDLMLFGAQGLSAHPALEVIEGDIRDQDHFRRSAAGCHAVLHLAAISNDPSFELDPHLSRSINFDCFRPMVESCVAEKVDRFIYASTSSVYGVSDSPDVTEEHPLVPLTDYNKYKGLCEPILLEYASPAFTPVIIRPATVCGYSPRLRLDLSVNILTNHAVNKRVITVFGGAQKRPNIHIDDLCELYVDMLTHPTEKVGSQTFNVAYENHSIAELAEIVRTVVEREIPGAPITITTQPSDDLRSYHVSSQKALRVLGYRPRRTIEDAVRDLCAAFQAGKIPEPFTDESYYNVKTVSRKMGARVS